MPVLEIKWKPSNVDLRIFAVIQIVVACIAAWILHGRFQWDSIAIGLLAISTCALIAGLAVPQSIRPLYLLWMVAGFPIGWCVSHALLVIVYFGVITPVALMLRLRGRNGLQLKRQPDATTYWSSRPEPNEPTRYFQQF